MSNASLHYLVKYWLVLEHGVSSNLSTRQSSNSYPSFSVRYLPCERWICGSSWLSTSLSTAVTFSSVHARFGRRCRAFVLSLTLESNDYAPQRAGHVSLPGPTAPLITELLQLPVPGYGTVYRHISEMTLTVQSVPAVTKDTFVWIVGPRRSANYFNCAV